MGKEAKQIGGVVVGAALGTAGVLTGNANMALTGGGMFLSSTRYLLFGGSEDRGRNISSTRADAERSLPLVYGKDLVGGGTIDARDIGDDGEELWLVSAYCHGSEDGSGVNDILTIYFKDDNDYKEAVLGAPPDAGLFDGADFYTNPGPDPNGILDARIHLGSHSQTVDADLDAEFSAYTTDHAGKGVCYSAIHLQWNEEVYSGLPEAHAEVEGNMVYDPRDDTWKHTYNPALHILDYLTSDKYGLGANYPERDSDGTVSEINEQSFIDMADFCEESVTIKYDDGNTVSQTRFEARGSLDTGDDPLRNLEKLLTSCRGEIIYQEGEFRLHIPRDKTTTSFTLNEDNIVGNWRWSRGGLSGTPNQVNASYWKSIFDDSQTSITWPDPGDTNPYLDNDNGYENVRSIELPLTKNGDRAKQIAMVALKEARQDLEVELTAKESALQLEVGDVVPVTHETPGWTDKPFWVRAITYQPEEQLVQLKLREFDATAYTLDESKKAAGPPGTNLPSSRDVDPPTNFTVTSDGTTTVGVENGVKVPAADITWTEPTNRKFLDHYEIEYKRSTASEYSHIASPQRGITEHTGVTLDGGATYDFRIRSVNVAGYKSSWVTDSVTADGSQGSEITPEVVVGLGSSDPNNQNFEITVNAGTDSSNPALEYRWRAELSPTSSERTYSSWTSISDGNTVTEQVSRDKTTAALIEVQARDTSFASNPRSTVTALAPPTSSDSSGSGATVIPTQTTPSGTDYEDEPDGTMIAVY